jgi:hypothetical protein
MAPDSLRLGVILVVLVIIIALVWKYWRCWRKDRFSYATPATPRVREATTDLFAGLTHMTKLSHQFEQTAKRLGDATAFAGARLSAFQLASTMCNAERALSGAPPTYANYLAIYRGLTSSDTALLNAADAYVNMGFEAQQLVGRDTQAPTAGDLAELGRVLNEMGRQLRKVVVLVHRLGAALDVE